MRRTYFGCFLEGLAMLVVLPCPRVPPSAQSTGPLAHYVEQLLFINWSGSFAPYIYIAFTALLESFDLIGALGLQ